MVSLNNVYVAGSRSGRLDPRPLLLEKIQVSYDYLSSHDRAELDIYSMLLDKVIDSLINARADDEMMLDLMARMPLGVRDVGDDIVECMLVIYV